MSTPWHTGRQYPILDVRQPSESCHRWRVTSPPSPILTLARTTATGDCSTCQGEGGVVMHVDSAKDLHLIVELAKIWRAQIFLDCFRHESSQYGREAQQRLSEVLPKFLQESHAEAPC